MTGIAGACTWVEKLVGFATSSTWRGGGVTHHVEVPGERRIAAHHRLHMVRIRLPHVEANVFVNLACGVTTLPVG
jgi:hypothetical protein